MKQALQTPFLLHATLIDYSQISFFPPWEFYEGAIFITFFNLQFLFSS